MVPLVFSSLCVMCLVFSVLVIQFVFVLVLNISISF